MQLNNIEILNIWWKHNQYFWRLFWRKSDTLASSLGLLCTYAHTPQRKCTRSSLDLSSFNSLQKQSYADSVAKIQASVQSHHSLHSGCVSSIIWILLVAIFFKKDAFSLTEIGTGELYFSLCIRTSSLFSLGIMELHLCTSLVLFLF